MSIEANSFIAGSTLEAYRIVAITGANTVGYPTGNQVLPIGVTLDQMKALGDAVPVLGPGAIAKVLLGDTLTAGNMVGATTNGAAVKMSLADTTTALTLASAYVGIYLDATGVATNIGRVYVMPGFDRE
jgi:hypothetical protein